MNIARISDIWVRGAYRLDDDGYFVTRKTDKQPAEKVKAFPYTSLEAAFATTSEPACCSCYQIDDGSYPWVRFANKLVIQESGLRVDVHWLHFELDIDKTTNGKIWPGVTEHVGNTWFADVAATAQYEKIAAFLAPLGASHYMSRGGLHVLVPIAPVPYEHFLSYAQHWLATHIQPKMPDVRKILPLSLDMSCVEPSRLHYLPRINKPGQGHLQLPLEIGSGRLTTLEAPAWIENSTSGILRGVELQLSRTERIEARKFVDRWLKSHVTWLETALPGTGRNARLYAFGGDVRQFEDAGLLPDAQQYLAFAIKLGENALVAAVHNAESAVMNGYNCGTGTDSIAALMLHIGKSQIRTDAIKNIAAALKGRKST